MRLRIKTDAAVGFFFFSFFFLFFFFCLRGKATSRDLCDRRVAKAIDRERNTAVGDEGDLERFFQRSLETDSPSGQTGRREVVGLVEGRN